MLFKSKKRLGQNFLIDKNIQRKIIEACELKSCDIVLEVGAGRGELTKLIAEKVSKVYALEIDSELCGLLRDNLKNYSKAQIINEDILKFNLRKYFMKDKISSGVKIIGNIPYYISSPIIGHLIKFREELTVIFITVQKEFAQRMTAFAGQKAYGAFSCFVQYYSEPKIIFTIKKTCFSPVPKVDSCLIRMNLLKQPRVQPKDEKLFFKIIRACFGKRRKTLRNSLRDIITKERLDKFFTKFAIDANVRPEDLSLEDFANLANT